METKKEKGKVAYMVAASMRYNGAKDPKDGRIVVNGWLVLKITRNWLGREKFTTIRYCKRYTEAVAALNKIYGL